MNPLNISLKLIVVLGTACAWLVYELAHSAEPNHFSLYRYSGDGFEVTFPSKPLEFRTNKGKILGHVNSYQAIVINPPSQYSVFVNHSPKRVFEDASIEAYLDGIVPGLMMASKDAALIYKRRTLFLGFPGIEYQYTHTIEDAPVVGRGIVFIIDGDHIRLSQIFATNDSSAATNFQQFINSFQLTQIDTPLSNQRFEDKSRGIAFSPPEAWDKGTSQYSQIIAIFSNPAGHSITVIDSGTPEYVCDNYKTEIETTQELQETGQTMVRGRPVTWLKSAAYNPIAEIRMMSIHYCLNTTRGAVIMLGMAPEGTFFRSETIFRKAADSMELRN